MQHFDWVEDLVFKNSVSHFEWKEEVRPLDFSNKVFEYDQKSIQMTSKSWISYSRSANLRFSRFQSNVVDVATILILPFEISDSSPIFVIEFVGVQNKIPVAIIDIEFLNKINPCRGSIQKIYDKWIKILPQNEIESDWFKEIKSDYAMNINCDSVQLENLKNCTSEYLDLFVENFYKLTNENFKLKDCDEIVNYKKHHIQNSPAYKIMRKEDYNWLTQFLNNYHFKIYA